MENITRARGHVLSPSSASSFPHTSSRAQLADIRREAAANCSYGRPKVRGPLLRDACLPDLASLVLGRGGFRQSECRSLRGAPRTRLRLPDLHSLPFALPGSFTFYGSPVTCPSSQQRVVDRHHCRRCRWSGRDGTERGVGVHTATLPPQRRSVGVNDSWNETPHPLRLYDMFSFSLSPGGALPKILP